MAMKNTAPADREGISYFSLKGKIKMTQKMTGERLLPRHRAEGVLVVRGGFVPNR